MGSSDIASEPLSADQQKCLDHLLQHGYAIFEGAIELALCDEIIQAITKLERKSSPSVKDYDFSGHKTIRYFDLLNRGEIWQRVATHPNLIPVLRAVLGEDMLLSTLGTAVIGPGESPQPIHCDDQIYDFKRPHRELVCNTLWALSDFREENGATRIIPDSHKWPENPDMNRQYDSIPAHMPKGSVCFVLGTCYHGGGENQTNERRWAQTINYCVGAIRQQENLMLSIPRELAATFNDELRELVGYRLSLRNVGHVDAKDPCDLLPVTGVNP
ncbi:MAG: ectoine hydroxylase-related dioxygenase (phytanoyl-CoA dioxygenase family) [Bermanella sp.]|jgi:ectoine hydroxylase-related dioxygenase (phytanoyl-CoA dioxygenase family)